jgi:hypothetical protein
VKILALAGDWHGDRVWANARLQSLGERGIQTVAHLGDFGVWPGPLGKAYLRSVEKTCAKYDIAVLVTPGNHEDWGRLTQLWANPKHQDEDGSLRPLYLTDHVAVLPRGYRWEMGGRSFVSLGGAPSLDFASRIEGKTFWPEEAMTPADVARTVRGGYADVMLTHDAPGSPWATSPVREILSSNPMGWTDRALAYARTGRDLVTEAFLGVAPRLLAHGHYHCSGQAKVRLPGATYDTTVWSLDANGRAGNLRLLDLETLRDLVLPD